MRRCPVILLTLVMFATTAVAAPIQWTVASGGNGHWYEAVCVPTGISWSAARAAALAAGGDLVSITSQAEQDMLTDRFFWNSTTQHSQACWQDYVGAGPPYHQNGPWIGATYITSGQWTWSNQEPFGYSNWYPGLSTSPTCAGCEHANLFYAVWDAMRWWIWAPGRAAPPGYVIEYTSTPLTPARRGTWGAVKTIYR